MREHARVPIIETGAGIVHTYFDASGDFDKGRAIIHNAKTRRVSVCNALDSLLVHASRLDDLYELIKPLQMHNVEIHADPQSFSILEPHYPAQLLHPARPEDYGQEFLDYKLAIKR